MDFSAIIQNFELVVVLACLAVGYVLKKWINDVKNQYIPTIMFFLGALLNVGIKGFSIENLVYGAIAGLASTGLHQAFTRFIEHPDQDTQNTDTAVQ